MSAIGRWSCGTSSPYWIEMSWACAACAAASAQRPAQNSTQERPQSARALRGSSRSRHSPVLALEERTGLVPPGGRREGVHDGERRLLHELLAADGGREVVRPRQEIPRRLRVAGEPAEDGLHGARARPEHVVVELLGELERRAGVLEPVR